DGLLVGRAGPAVSTAPHAERADDRASRSPPRARRHRDPHGPRLRRVAVRRRDDERPRARQEADEPERARRARYRQRHVRRDPPRRRRGRARVPGDALGGGRRASSRHALLPRAAQAGGSEGDARRPCRLAACGAQSARPRHAAADDTARLTRPRAAIVVTGSELVRGERTDRNGPFLAAEALRHGLEPARITIVGDNPAELEAALREGLAADACFVSGGLGPTHDDRTVEMLARAADLELVVDAELEEQIGAASRAVAERLKRPYADFKAGVRKQATRPAPAVSIGLAGTAPGLVFRAPNGCVVVVLPGPPSELQRLWPNALASEPVQELLTRTRPPGRRILRLYGVSESAVARALEEGGGDGDGVEVTICARDFEIH